MSSRKDNGSSTVAPPQDESASGVVIRPIGEALDEVTRELNVRRRCYHRWVEDGRLSKTDAKDRLERLEAAEAYLAKLNDLQPEAAAANGAGDPY